MVGMLRRRPSRAYTKRARERSRVAAHIARAEKIARENAPVLDPVRSLVRALLLQALREYREEGRFPKNHHTDRHTPVFVDEVGTHCAVGHLLALSGEGALVEKISAERNLATVHQLSDEPALAQWLRASGLSLAEAELIQPFYSPTCSSPTECFCAPYRTHSASQTRLESSDGGALTTAVLDCTLTAHDTARVDRIYGNTTGHSVGEIISVHLTSFAQQTRALVPVEQTGTQPLLWHNGADAGQTVYLALPVSADGTATCVGIGWGGVLTHTQATTAISALISDNCAATFRSLDRSGDDRVCTGGSCTVPAPSHTETPSATLSILLSLVSALVVRRARRARSSPRAPSASGAQSHSSIAK